MKKFFVFCFLLIFVLSISTCCFALKTSLFHQEKTPDLPFDVGTILGYIQWIGIAIAIGYLIIMGIRFTVGSVDDKAEIKKHMVPFLIGLVLIVGISSIARAIHDAVV